MVSGFKGNYAAEMDDFLASFFYEPQGFLIDEIITIDAQTYRVEARMETDKSLPFADLQRGDPRRHPRHISAVELLVLTANLGSVHAYFIHGCRWDEGWVGFANRIYRAEFKQLAQRDGPLRLVSQETRRRVGKNRLVIRFSFHFYQADRLVYLGDQLAHFFKTD